MARHCTRSLTRMQALQRFQSGCTVHTDPGHGASTAGTHSIHTCEPHGAPNSLNSALDRDGRRDIPKRRTMLQLLPHARCVIEAHRTDPFEPCGTAHTPLVDTIATSVSTASRTPVDCSRWFLVSNGLLRVDLECSAWSSTMSSPIMMVAPTPTRRDHLALNVTACMHPAGSCKASHQWDEQKRSTMHWRSALFNAR